MWFWYDLRLPPGIFGDRTDYLEGPKWTDSQWVRFRHGQPQKMGGYTFFSTTQTLAATAQARDITQWRALDGTRYFAVASTCGVWIWSDAEGSLEDITPFRVTTTPTNIMDTTDTSAVVTINETSHGGVTGDRVNIASASAIGGITLAGDYPITYVDANSYTVTHSSAATSTVSGGGGTPTIKYTVNCLQQDGTQGFGWGAGTYGSSTWGTPRTAAATDDEIGVISLNNWGEDLIITYRDGAAWLWDKSNGTSTRAVALSSNDPSQVGIAAISDPVPHLIFFGAHDGSSYDPLLIKWSDEEDYDTWTAAATNTAGDLRLRYGNRIVAAKRGRNAIFVWTDTTMYSMQYIGPPFVFGLPPIGETTILGPNSVVTHENLAIWMGEGNFYMFDGQIRIMPCSVRDVVFDDINLIQKEKIQGFFNTKFNEFWFLYPDSTSLENSRYVVYNMEEKAWTQGTLQRNCGMDARLWDNPLMIDTSGNLHQHEDGYNASDGTAITANIETGAFEIKEEGVGPGMSFTYIDKVIPDMTMTAGKTINYYVTSKRTPQATAVLKGPVAVTGTTSQISKRARGRQHQFKFESTDSDNEWQLGTWRIRAKKDGYK